MISFNRLAIWLNHVVRRHPSRWLYTDRLLGNYMDGKERPFMTRDWGAAAIWDVGASVGKYTTILARSNPNGMIYAFEPNLNSLYYLAFRTARYRNVVIVPNALTLDGRPIPGSHDPDFTSPPTGPLVSTISIQEAIARTGVPRFVKVDIEGAEFDLFKSKAIECLHPATILLSWHPILAGREIYEVDGWRNVQLDANLTLLTPHGQSGTP
ncbi:MAG: FkbM family methyltransferase [Verrucomicrobia bacterium]|nr:FkbM family methyltransferase [Verrucomicrobiota bacterium]MDE3099293.1 FkbM family methyltransferase [Verrucomicrobiota bacterium]